MWCKCKYTQIVNYNQRRLLNKTKTFLVSAIIARGQETERRAVTSLTRSGCFQPSTNPVPSDKAPRNHRALSLSFPLISLWKPLLQTENESLSLFSHPWRCRCSTPLPVNSPTSRHSTVQTGGASPGLRGSPLGCRVIAMQCLLPLIIILLLLTPNQKNRTKKE